MKLTQVPLLGVLATTILLVGGCATRDVNPQAARTGFGYVDFYTQPKTESWWKVEVFDAAKNSYRDFTADFKAPGQDIFRVEAPPGRYRARIAFVNRFIEAPAEVEVEVQAGLITSVPVTLETSGASNIRTVEDRAGGSLRKKVADNPETVWKISAAAKPALPYALKAQMSYWK